MIRRTLVLTVAVALVATAVLFAGLGLLAPAPEVLTLASTDPAVCQVSCPALFDLCLKDNNQRACALFDLCC